ncbi:MAG: DUF3368 domain-containing protein [Verrucomicrobiota bacterium]|jgi:predicted nucleic acid-binding protein
MIVVSNATPLCYLTLIGHEDILAKLYGDIHTTQTVAEEFRHPAAPAEVRSLATTPPDWLKIHSDPEETDTTMAALDPGERTALRLARQLHSDVVLLDEAAARAFAIQRGLRISGTLGFLYDAAQAGLLKLPASLELLRKTNFRASPELWKPLYTR